MSTKRRMSAMLNRVGPPSAMGGNRLHVRHVPEAVMHSFAKRASLIWWRVGMRRSHPDGRLGSPPCVAE